MQDYRSSRVNSRDKKFLACFFFFIIISLSLLRRVRAHTNTRKRKSNWRQGAHTLLFTLQTYDIQIHGQTEKRRGTSCTGTQGEEGKATISEIGKRADYSDGPGTPSKDVYCFCRVCYPLSPSLPFPLVLLAGSSLWQRETEKIQDLTDRQAKIT